MNTLKNQVEQDPANAQGDILSATLERRSFLKYAGAGAAGIALIAAGCKKDKMDGRANFGRDDIAILNYAYALEQLEAAFYTKVVASPYTGISSLESSIMTDIRDHEIAHREFFKAALGGSAIPSLEVDFSSVNFSSRDSVLSTAKAFEDLGVSAYNGAGFLIKSDAYLTLAGKIVSVEARHAAMIRDLISNGTFADSSVVNAQGLDTSRSPSQVLAIAGTYIKTPLNVEGLPTY
ncbi:ferritin-like domain-containing protein [Daejeonella sp. JGW-45]|uniref:ferritin-like domain-containing protein n=1 Tax=Daejeonella sp. JGW-45 TaxID=3034148 RepID=UPI0023EB2DEA|nr:ferritin-like domain-containing protein [Daejeonella sp. JGW-45]